MTHCDSPGCTGHLGKFRNCVAECLYRMSLEGFYQSTGEGDYRGYFTLMQVPDDAAYNLDGRIVVIPSGWYVASQDGNGFFDATRYGAEDDAVAVFEAEDVQYGKWITGND